MATNTANALLPLLWESCKLGDAARLAKLLEDHGNQLNDIDAGDFYFLTILAICQCRKPECVRVLIDHGVVDVTYGYRLVHSNRSILYVVACALSVERPQSGFLEGDYVLVADLLIQSGVPMHVVCPDKDKTLNLLQDMHVESGTKKCKERDGLVSLLKQEYWSGCYNQKNPFLNMKAPEEGLLLILKGSANQNGEDDDKKVVDPKKLRSIRPEMRPLVLNAIQQHKEKDYRCFLLILLATKTHHDDNKSKKKKQESTSGYLAALKGRFRRKLFGQQHHSNGDNKSKNNHLLSVFNGFEHSVHAKIAGFLGVTSIALSNAEQAEKHLKNM